MMNEKLTAGNKCLMARDFDMARSLFNEVLKEDPQNVCAVRGKMFCDHILFQLSGSISHFVISIVKPFLL